MKKLFVNTFLLLSTGLLITSCLKDDLVLDPNKTNNVIEFGNPADIASPEGAKYYLYSPALEIKTEIDLPITVSYSGAQTAPQDISVKVAVASTTVIDEYNTQQGTNYIILPSNLYTFSTTDLVIPNGQRTSSFNIKFKTAQFDLTKNYVLPITITSASFGIISGNFRTILLNIKAKNKYDGIYNVTAIDAMRDVFAPSLSGYYPIESDLITQGANSVEMYDGRYAANNYAHPIKSGTATSSYGSFSPVFTIRTCSLFCSSIINTWKIP